MLTSQFHNEHYFLFGNANKKKYGNFFKVMLSNDFQFQFLDNYPLRIELY